MTTATYSAIPVNMAQVEVTFASAGTGSDRYYVSVLDRSGAHRKFFGGHGSISVEKVRPGLWTALGPSVGGVYRFRANGGGRMDAVLALLDMMRRDQQKHLPA